MCQRTGTITRIVQAMCHTVDGRLEESVLGIVTGIEELIMESTTTLMNPFTSTFVSWCFVGRMMSGDLLTTENVFGKM